MQVNGRADPQPTFNDEGKIEYLKTPKLVKIERVNLALAGSKGQGPMEGFTRKSAFILI